MHRAFAERGQDRGVCDFAIDGGESGDPIIGRLVETGLHDEQTGTAYAVIDGTDALAAAQLGNAVLAVQAVQDNPDLVFRRIMFAGGPADVLDDLLAVALRGSGFLSHLHSLVVAMSQKPALIKST